jgi:S1-C subfamily serine protease
VGFLVTRDGRVLTALHRVMSLRNATVSLPGGGVFTRVQVLAFDEPRDLVLLKIPGAGLPALEPAGAALPAAGDPVLLVGSPEDIWNNAVPGLVRGVFQSKAGPDARIIDLDAPETPNHAGGPLLSAKGRLLGMLDSMGGSTFAVPIAETRALLAAAGEPFSLAQLAARVQGSVVPTEASRPPVPGK